MAARDPDLQTAEIHIRLALINRCNGLGTAEIARAGLSLTEKGSYASRVCYATTPIPRAIELWPKLGDAG